MTSAGFMECKAALTEANGSLEEAVKILRTRGQAKAAKRAGRATAQGLVSSYIHPGGQVGVLLEVNCESDFVARTDDFQTLVKDIAMHIAAADPRYVRREEVTDEMLEAERKIYREQAIESGKPEQVIDRIVDGKMEKFFGESVLLEQAFVKDPDQTVGDLVAAKVGKLGENIQVGRFARFKLGEGPATAGADNGDGD